MGINSKSIAVTFAAVVAAGLATSCADSWSTGEPSVPDQETIAWTDCGDLQCATLDVPVDNDDPSLGTVSLAVNVHRATKPRDRVGYLFVNPGGPGGSGIELAAAARLSFSPEVVERFDIVGFDPRGVGESGPEFTCGDPAEFTRRITSIKAPFEVDELELGRSAIASCQESMGPIATRLGTRYVADDIDAIRAAFGAEQISYLGFSYGSAVGTWYASLYPHRVEAMVLDGAAEVVPDADTPEDRLESSIESIEAFATNLDKALAACQDPSCPIFGHDGGPEGAFRAAMQNTGLINSAVGDPSGALLGLVTFLYSEADWPGLWQAINDLEARDPAAFVANAMIQKPEPGASFTEHVNCLDSWALFPTLSEADRLADQATANQVFLQRYPLLAEAGTPPTSPCAFLGSILPEKPTTTVPINGGGVPILVIGNHSDPATPYAASQRLASNVLTNGYLLETDHPRHVVYPMNDCVNDKVHNVLIRHELPAEHHSNCERQEPTPTMASIQVFETCRALASLWNPEATGRLTTKLCTKITDEHVPGKTYDEIMALIDPSDPTASDHLAASFRKHAELILGPSQATVPDLPAQTPSTADGEEGSRPPTKE